MDKQILKSLLNYQFWSDHKHQVVASLFSDEIQEIFEIIESAHNKYQKDISSAELVALWNNTYPVATRAERDAIEGVILDVENTEELSPEIASDIVDGLWKRDIGTKIGQLGVAIAEGRTDAFSKLLKLLETTNDGFKPDDFGDPVTDDINELLAITGNEGRFKFNIRSLAEKVYGPAPGDFIIAFARPETGKTSFTVSLAAAPDGFAAQGAKVLYLGNEEDVRRTKLRAIQAYSGMTKEQVAADPVKAQEKYQEIAPNLVMKAVHDWDTNKLEAYVEDQKPDIVIIDQLDKVITTSKAEGVDRLGELYIWARAVGVRHNCAVIAVSQASIDGEGKTILTPDMMEGSKTRKYAEGDLIIGIGKYPDKADGTPDPIRFLFVGKNKLTGFHGLITCKLEAAIGRYMD